MCKNKIMIITAGLFLLFTGRAHAAGGNISKVGTSDNELKNTTGSGGCTNWYRQDLFKLASCFHFHRFEPVGSKWNPDEYIRAVKSTGVSVVTLEAKDSLGYRYYEGKKGIKHPSVDYDYYGERSRVLRENGIKVIAYFGLGDDSAAFEKRPELRMDEGSLKPVHMPDKPSKANLNSPYFEEVFLPELKEFLTAYKPDALWFDIFTGDPYWGMSYDPWTEKLFEEKTGRPLLPPENDPNPRETARFFIRRAEQLRKQIVDEVKKIAPETQVAIASSFRYPRQEGIVTDFLSRDTFWGYCGEICESGYYARLWSATGKPSEIISPASRWWGEKDKKSPWQIEREAATVLASGSTYMCYVIPRASGELNERMCAEVGAVRRRLMEKAAWFTGGSPLPDICLFTCSASEEEFSCRFIENKAKNDHIAQTNDRFFSQDFECASRFFQRHGYNFGVQTDLTLGRFLKQHTPSCIVAPHLPVLDAGSRSNLMAFVRQGGLLVLSGKVDDELAAEIGLEAAERKGPERSYVRAAPGLASGALAGLDTPVPVRFYQALFKDAAPLLEIAPVMHESRFEQGDWFQWGYPDADISAYVCGAAVKKTGKGTILYFAFNPFTAYAHEPTPQTAAIISDSLLASGFSPAIRCVADVPAELVLRGDETKRWCHLINQTEAFEAGRKMKLFPGEFNVPLQNLEMEVHGSAPRSVRLQPGNRKIPFTSTKDGWRVVVPELKTHEIVEWTLSSKTGHTK